MGDKRDNSGNHRKMQRQQSSRRRDLKTGKSRNISATDQKIPEGDSGGREALTFIKEFNKYLAIAGFRNAKIKNSEKLLKAIGLEKPSGVEVQLFDAKLIASARHLHFAVLNALTVFQNGGNISKSLGMEVLLFAAAQRQIRKATELIGIKPNIRDVAVVIAGKESDDVKRAVLIVSKNVGGQLDDRVLELSRDKMKAVRKAFEISDVELEAVADQNQVNRALVDLVIERMALLAAQR